jgi:hypothetical protein
MQGQASALALYVPVESRDAQRKQRASKRITMPQAKNMMDAVSFAKSIGLPLVAHLTIHWSLTDVGDDPDGRLFAKVREGLDKWLDRHGIEFSGVWARERQSSWQSDVVHCHLLFHLPVEYRMSQKLREVEEAILRLVKRHGGDVTDDRAIKLVIHDNPDGKYLIKGGGPDVWTRFRVRKENRRWQGIIHGKRCGTTQNIGSAARPVPREGNGALKERLAQPRKPKTCRLANEPLYQVDHQKENDSA